MLKSIIKNKITVCMNEHGLLGRSQHGFCKKKSCLTGLLGLSEGIYKRKDKREPGMYFVWIYAIDY